MLGFASTGGWRAVGAWQMAMRGMLDPVVAKTALASFHQFRRWSALLRREIDKDISVSGWGAVQDGLRLGNHLKRFPQRTEVRPMSRIEKEP